MTQAEFDEAMRAGELRVALVGMSNAGKTKAGRALQKTGDFEHYEVDADIRRSLGLTNMNELADWLGLPDSDGYSEREKKYLELEEMYTTVERNAAKNLVLDTTGSVVHLSDQAQQKVREDALVVHFDVGNSTLDTLIEKFFETPKPIVWGEYFAPREGEGVRETLIRSYPKLLQERLQRFRSLSHINIPAATIDLSDGRAILTSIRSHLV